MRNSDQLRSDLQLPHILSIFDRFYFRLPSEHSTCLSRGSPRRRSGRSDFCTSAIAFQAPSCTCGALRPTHMTRGSRLLRYSNDALCPGNLRERRGGGASSTENKFPVSLRRPVGEKKNKKFPCLLKPLRWTWVDFIEFYFFAHLYQHSSSTQTSC